MIQWLFYLDETEIEEPIGFNEIELSAKRHDTLHGMTFEAATSLLKFHGSAAINYLETAWANSGVKANVIFSAWFVCEGGYDYEQVLTGRLNFAKRRKQCGSICTIELPWEQESCAVVFNSRYDQKVDVDKAIGVDGSTALQDYNALGVETELPAHDLLASTEGYVLDEGDTIDLSIFVNGTNNWAVRPTYGRQIYASINESQLNPSVFAASDNGFNDSALSPIVLLDEVIGCFDGVFDYEVRMKGSYNIDNEPPANIDLLRLVVAYGEYPGSLTILHQTVLVSGGGPDASGSFDQTYSGTLTLPQGQGFYAYLENDGSVVLLGPEGFVTFDKETYVNFSGVKSCPATNAELYMIHETLSRVSEAITNGCMKVKSEYFGRVDSEPYSFSSDGCGGLRALTSGLKIRRATEDNFFVSMKDLVEGLNAIDNIGIGLEDGIMRIEDVSYFYQDAEVLRHTFIPDGDFLVEEKGHYSKINVGYKKWEVEEINGLDEFNSNRQYNTSIDTISNTLEITSGLVAGTYPIEITRQQSFADSGGADQKYDNETFIICMKRDDYPYLNLSVEQGAVDNPENVFSPQTMYNWRISPLRNLMRWYKSIAAGFASISDTANRLFFSAGTGNLLAKAKLTGTDCRLENSEIQENQDIFVTNFSEVSEYSPLWENEQLTYDYPMSLAEYQAVKSKPYRYISVQCGTGDMEEFWIKEIKFKPVKGKATFILRRKYGL